MFKEYRRRLARGANLDPTAPIAGASGALREALSSRAQPDDATNAEDATPSLPPEVEVSPPSLPPGG